MLFDCLLQVCGASGIFAIASRLPKTIGAPEFKFFTFDSARHLISTILSRISWIASQVSAVA